MISAAYCAAVGGLLAMDLIANAQALRKERLSFVSYLLVAYAALLVVPLLGAGAVTVVGGAVALGAFLSYARMVGLTHQRGQTLPAALLIAAFFGVTRLQWYGLFQAMPVFSLFALLALAAARGKPQAFLQTLCLSWLGVLVYGYLWAHAALLEPGSLAVILLLAKAADVAWSVAKRARPTLGVQLAASAGAGVATGAFIHGEGWLPVTLKQGAFLGLCVGGGIALASHAFKLILEDVTGASQERPAKGTQIFAFGFAVALAYHWLRYLS